MAFRLATLLMAIWSLTCAGQGQMEENLRFLRPAPRESPDKECELQRNLRELAEHYRKRADQQQRDVAATGAAPPGGSRPAAETAAGATVDREAAQNLEGYTRRSAAALCLAAERSGQYRGGRGAGRDASASSVEAGDSVFDSDDTSNASDDPMPFEPLHPPEVDPEMAEKLEKMASVMREILAYARDGAAYRAAELARSVAAIAACKEEIEALTDEGVDENKNASAEARGLHVECRTLEVQKRTAADETCASLHHRWSTLEMPACSAPMSPQLDEEFENFTDSLACVRYLHSWSQDKRASLLAWKTYCDGNETAAGDVRQECGTKQADFESQFCSFRSSVFGQCSDIAGCHQSRNASHIALVAEARRNETLDKLDFEAAEEILCELTILNETMNITRKQELRDRCLGLIPDTSILDIYWPEVPQAPECDTTAVDNKPCDGAWRQKEYNRSWAEKAPVVSCTECSPLRRLSGGDQFEVGTTIPMSATA